MPTLLVTGDTSNKHGEDQVVYDARKFIITFIRDNVIPCSTGASIYCLHRWRHVSTSERPIQIDPKHSMVTDEYCTRFRLLLLHSKRATAVDQNVISNNPETNTTATFLIQYGK